MPFILPELMNTKLRMYRLAVTCSRSRSVEALFANDPWLLAYLGHRHETSCGGCFCSSSDFLRLSNENAACPAREHKKYRRSSPANHYLAVSVVLLKYAVIPATSLIARQPLCPSFEMSPVIKSAGHTTASTPRPHILYKFEVERDGKVDVVQKRYSEVGVPFGPTGNSLLTFPLSSWHFTLRWVPGV